MCTQVHLEPKRPRISTYLGESFQLICLIFSETFWLSKYPFSDSLIKKWPYDVEDCITLATKGLKLRVARRVWRDYYRHSFARQHCADPSTEGLADQQRRRKISEEDSRRDEQERAKNHEFWAWKARNLSAWAPRGMG